MALTSALIGELDAIGDWGLMTTDVNLVITGWNRWLERYAGRAADTVIGRPLFDAFPELVTRRLDRFYQQAVEGKTSVLSQRLHKYVLLIPPPTVGARFDCMQQSGRIMPIVDGDRVSGTLTMIDDVTERVAYEAELREQVAALRDTDRQKDEFLAMLAHELRNPLAPIRNAVHVLRQLGANSPKVVWCGDVIARQAEQLTRLVDDLLDVSRVSSGKITLHRQTVDLGAVIKQALETNRPIIEERRHEIRIVVSNEPVTVDGDYARLVQVVSNLVNNAAKYTEEGGSITLSVTREGRLRDTRPEAVICIRDTGRGIEPEVLPHLFDLFFQADATLDRADGGLGIGLSLVRSLVELHDGAIEARSDGKGLGSEFIVRLPLPIDPSTVRPSDAPDQWIAPTSILVADGNRDSADSMAVLLRLDGHQVHTAHDGRRAVEIAVRERPSVVLLDLDLPYLDGYEACRAIREGGLTDSLIVAMTGFELGLEKRRSKDPCFDAHERKPVDPAVLRRLLADHANR